MAFRQKTILRHAIAGSRTIARHVALEALTASRLLSGVDQLQDDRPRVQILLLHHLTKQEIGPFHHLILTLRRHYTLIDYSDAVSRIMMGSLDRPYLSFTFDDGLRSCLAAARVLEEFGARGCFFVCPSMLGADRATQDLFCRVQLRIRTTQFLDWSDVESLLNRGHEIGSHTWDHANMATLNGPQLTEQLARSKAALHQRLGSVRHFAWPYGRFHDFSLEAAQAVRDAGYYSCASGERGCHAAPSQSMPHWLCIRRDSIQARWPWRHIGYFLQRSAKHPREAHHTWPPAWQFGESSRSVGLHANASPTEEGKDAA